MKTCPHPNCKKENELDAQFCVECGTKLDVVERPVSGRQQVDAKLASVGGWLGYFIYLGLFIGAPIMTLLDINEVTKMKGLLQEWFISVLVMVDIGLIILAIYVGIILLKKKRYAPLWAKIFLGINLALSILALFGNDPKEQGLAVRGLITQSIWLAYFFKSKRVKAVYFPEKVELVHKP